VKRAARKTGAIWWIAPVVVNKRMSSETVVCRELQVTLYGADRTSLACDLTAGAPYPGIGILLTRNIQRVKSIEPEASGLSRYCCVGDRISASNKLSTT
jgi:hypothetical protein